jgi:hypothetical protein
MNGRSLWAPGVLSVVRCAAREAFSVSRIPGIKYGIVPTERRFLFKIASIGPVMEVIAVGIGLFEKPAVGMV